MKYKIPVSWEMCGIVEVEADSLDEAILEADDDCTPLPEGSYVDGSFRVDADFAAEYN